MKELPLSEEERRDGDRGEQKVTKKGGRGDGRSPGSEGGEGQGVVEKYA